MDTARNKSVPIELIEDSEANANFFRENILRLHKTNRRTTDCPAVNGDSTYTRAPCPNLAILATAENKFVKIELLEVCKTIENNLQSLQSN